MLDTIKHITDDNFFQDDSAIQLLQRCRQHLSEKLDFRVSPVCQVVQKRKLFELTCGKASFDCLLW